MKQTARPTLYVSDSGGGSLYGRLINHPAALAATERAADRVPLEPQAAPLCQVAEYPRDGQRLPYRVLHDSTVHRPFGRYVVYVGERRLGAQLSVPCCADCERMESPPRPASSLEHELSILRPSKCAIRTGLDGQKIKRCSGCRRNKPLPEFNQGSGPGGLHRHCRACQRKYRRMAHQRGDNA